MFYYIQSTLKCVHLNVSLQGQMHCFVCHCLSSYSLLFGQHVASTVKITERGTLYSKSLFKKGSLIFPIIE